MQPKWMSYPAGKMGYFDFCKLSSRLLSRYPFSGVGTEGERAPPKVWICRKFGQNS